MHITNNVMKFEQYSTNTTDVIFAIKSVRNSLIDSGLYALYILRMLLSNVIVIESKDGRLAEGMKLSKSTLVWSWWCAVSSLVVCRA